MIRHELEDAADPRCRPAPRRSTHRSVRPAGRPPSRQGQKGNAKSQPRAFGPETRSQPKRRVFYEVLYLMHGGALPRGSRKAPRSPTHSTPRSWFHSSSASQSCSVGARGSRSRAAEFRCVAHLDTCDKCQKTMVVFFN